MASVTIDTCVLAAPPDSSTRDEVMSYVENLLDWKLLLKEPWIAIFMSERAAEAMLDANVYPLRDQLKLLFSKKGIQEYDVNTVASLVDELLKKTPGLETYFGINDVLHENLSTLPDLLSLHTGPELASELARVIVIIAILRTCCRKPVLDHSLIIKPWNGSLSVKIKTQIVEIETSRNDIEGFQHTPEYFEGEILTCQNFREFVLNIDETSVWEAAKDEIGLILATKLAVFKHRIMRNLEPEWDSITGFTFGKQFYSRMRECERGGCLGLVERTIDAIIDTIDELKLSQVHIKRTGKGGNNPQETRGQDKAWRRNINDEYRLHYWECNDGTLEFASVGPHNMFDIPR